MARIKSLKELGKGSWKIASISPVKKPVNPKPVTSSVIHTILFSAVVKRWPEAVAEYPAQVPGRKFRLDIAFVDNWLAIEVDGWSVHGKFLADFKRDRIRQNILVMRGWRILRFSAADIHQDLEGCLSIIKTTLEMSNG